MNRFDNTKLINIGVEVERAFPVDTIAVLVDIHGECPTKEACTAEYNRKSKMVREGIVAAGFGEEELKSNRFTVGPHNERLYRKDKGGNYYHASNELRGFEYEGTMSLEAPYSSENARRIWAALQGCGDGIGFSLDTKLADERQARKSLLSEAVGEGRRQAEIIADAAGARVVGISSISHRYETGEVSRRRGLYGMCNFSDDASAPDFNPDDITIYCEIKMQWEIERI